MIEICKHEFCTGCEACMSACPTDAISMEPDAKGFMRPLIDEDKCNQCGLCVKICPANVPGDIKKNQIGKKVFAAWLKDKKVRKESSSGGIFSAIADYILNKGGVVFGARWTKDLSVVLDYCTDREGLSNFRGSKYVQGRVQDSYKKARYFLDDGKDVLFSGTPCQIAGLKSYLRKNYHNLLTIDFICHGVPSPMVFRDYIKCMENKYNEKVLSIRFRDKVPSWLSSSVRIEFENAVYSKSVYSDLYFVAFAWNYILRECCHHCKYTNLNRMGDITIADFWGFRPKNWKMLDFDKGCSLVIPNTKVGIDVFEAVSNEMIYEERAIDEAIRGNKCLSRSYQKANNSDIFWDEYLASKDFEIASQKYIAPIKVGFKGIFFRWINRYIFLLPDPARDLIRKSRMILSKKLKNI